MRKMEKYIGLTKKKKFIWNKFPMDGKSVNNLVINSFL